MYRSINHTGATMMSTTHVSGVRAPIVPKSGVSRTFCPRTPCSITPSDMHRRRVFALRPFAWCPRLRPILSTRGSRADAAELVHHQLGLAHVPRGAPSPPARAPAGIPHIVEKKYDHGGHEKRGGHEGEQGIHASHGGAGEQEGVHTSHGGAGQGGAPPAAGTSDGDGGAPPAGGDPVSHDGAPPAVDDPASQDGHGEDGHGGASDGGAPPAEGDWVSHGGEGNHDVHHGGKDIRAFPATGDRLFLYLLMSICGGTADDGDVMIV